MEHFNGLTPAEAERLALLVEELGEAAQAIGKILRHGYESRNPLIMNGPTNRESLEKEMADVFVAARMLFAAGDLRRVACSENEERKASSVCQYLHHQGLDVIPDLDTEIVRLKEERDRLATDVERLRADAERYRWRPMRTAPKDGTAVLVLLDGSDIPRGVRWISSPKDPRATAQFSAPGWYMTWDSTRINDFEGPHYWMHCPEDPDDETMAADKAQREPR